VTNKLPAVLGLMMLKSTRSLRSDTPWTFDNWTGILSF